MTTIQKNNFLHSIQKYFSSQPVLRAYLFGSFARDEQNEKSDVDLLVELDPKIPMGLEFCQMYLDLKKITGREVDLVTPAAISRHVKPFIEKEKVLIYERKAG